MEHDWMLRNLLNNETRNWGIYHNGRYFIDADPIAFRWILHYTRCQSLPSNILNSPTELEMIRSLADFLCFQNMLEYLGERIETCNQIQAELKDLRRLKEKINGMDGIIFISNINTNSACKVTALWSASDVDVERSLIKCPKCSANQENHHCERLAGQRRAVNTVAKILERL